MDTDINFGQMALVMKVIGLMIRQTALENCNMQMVIFTRVNGVMTKHMEKALTHMLTVLITTVTGSRISSMAMAWNLGQMVPSMKVSIGMVRKTAKVNLLSQMALLMKENSKQMR